LIENAQEPPVDLKDFVAEHRLPPAYADLATRWYLPLADELARVRETAGRPLVIGINGSQGSGKSTLAALLKHLFITRHALRAIDLSIDDFYLPQAQRQQLATEEHPLLATRGVPGTHDIPLMSRTLEALTSQQASVPIPRFDKASDDRVAQAHWKQETAPVDMVILEGWCLGSPPQNEDELQAPINLLEANEDPDVRWRHYVNRQISEQYQALYDRIDLWIMLKAPSFDCVYQWRLEQERKLAARIAPHADGKGIMSPEELARFIEHYQRLTTHTLRTLPQQVNFLFELDAERNIRAASKPRDLPLV